jgi:Ca-activated chloride channel family protein
MNMQDWFSKYWFLPSTLSSFDWANPFYLYSLPLIPILFLLRDWLRNNSTQKLNVAFPANEIQSNWISFLRFIPGIFLMFTTALMTNLEKELTLCWQWIFLNQWIIKIFHRAV